MCCTRLRRGSLRLRSLAAPLLGIGLMCLASSVALPAEPEFRLVGAELAPYAYQENSQVRGLGIEIMQEIGRRLGHSGKVTLMPFKRAFQNARSRNNLLMAPVARVPSREGQLQWAIHFIDDQFFYVSRAESRPLTHAQARQGGVIGVLAGSAPLAQLLQAGVSNYLEQTRDTANIDMLRIGRIDAWFTSAILLSAAFNSNPELSPADFVIGAAQSRHCVYIVASNDTAAAQLHPWQQTFATMQADGTVQEIVSHYLDPALQALLDTRKGTGSGCE